MPRRRIKNTKKSIKKTQRETSNLITKNKTAIAVGLASVLLLIALAVNYSIKKSQGKIILNPTVIPFPTETTLTSSPTSPVQKEATSSAKSIMVKKLPLTSSEKFEYIVKKGDTLYSIGTTFCNHKAAWIDIVEDNKLTENYKLYSGNVLTISCR